MAANSATNQRYMHNISSNGLQRTMRPQPDLQSQRSMSLSSRSFRPHDAAGRTMSMTMNTARCNSISNQKYQPASRAMSMSSSARPTNRGLSSRSGSLTGQSRAQYQRTNQAPLRASRANSRNNSRANSLTSNTAHTKIIKTTKEKDHEGRTKSITTTTIEKRGDMKIVRTTIIQPAVIDEDAEMEAFDELEDFDEDLTGNNYYDDHGMNNGHFLGDLEEDAYQEEEEEQDEDDYYQDPYKNGAALAAAAALNHGSKQQTPNVLHKKEVEQQQQYQIHPNPNLHMKTKVARKQGELNRNQRQNSIPKRNEVRFQNDHEAVGEEVDGSVHEHTYDDSQGYKHHGPVANKPQAQSENIASSNPNGSNVSLRKVNKSVSIVTPPKDTVSSTQDANAYIASPTKDSSMVVSPSSAVYNDDIYDDNDSDNMVMDENGDEIMVVSSEMSPVSFSEAAGKRLSEIQEVTESYEDEELMEEPIENPVGLDHTLAANPVIQQQTSTSAKLPQNKLASSVEGVVTSPGANLSPIIDPKFALASAMTTNSSIASEENYYEAQEQISKLPTIGMNGYDGTEMEPKVSTPSQQNANRQSLPSHSYRNLLFNDTKKSPLRNSISTFDSRHDGYNGTQNSNIFKTQQQVDIPTPPSTNGLNSPIENQHREFKQDSEPNMINSKSQPKILKSVLKNSSSRVASPVASVKSPTVSDTNLQFAPNHISARSRPVSHVPTINPANEKRNEISPEEMYAIALKAAEKKVYGDRVNKSQYEAPGNVNNNVEQVSLHEKASPVASPTQKYGFSQPGSPYQSNAAGLGFKMHSLRDSNTNNKPKTEYQDTGKLKKFYKNEQKQQKKQWETERKAAAESSLIQKISEKVEKEVKMMPVDPDVELKILQDEERRKYESQALQNSKAELQTQSQHNSSLVQPAQTVEAPSPQANKKLRLFRLSRKKSRTEGSLPNESDTVVSQEPRNSISSATNDGSSKKKLFSFGLSRDAHHSTAHHSEVASSPNTQIGNDPVDTLNATHNIPTDAQSERKTVENHNALPTNDMDSSHNIVHIDPSANPELHVYSTAEGNAGNFDIHTIPEDDTVHATTQTETGNKIENAYVQPKMPIMQDNIGSAGNLAKVGTYNSSNVESTYTSNATNEINVNSLNATNSSKIGSVSRENALANGVETMNMTNRNQFISGASNKEDNVGVDNVKPTRIPSNTSSKKQGKAGKGSRKFMKFFNL